MKERLVFYLRYLLFWLGFLIFFKTTFIIYHITKLRGVSYIDIFKIYLHGLKLDISLIGYILLIPTALIILLSSFKNRILKPIINVYTLIIILPLSLLLLIDHELYNYWGFRLDDTFIDYIATPKEMLASLNLFHIVFLIIFLVIVYFLVYNVLYLKWVRGKMKYFSLPSWISSVVFLFILAFLFLPIRGGIGTAPLNTGSVYFHDNIIVNHAAVNPIWNFLYTLSEKDKLNHDITFFNENEVREYMSNIYNEDDDLQKQMIIPDTPNIILIILESFGGNTIKEISGIEGVTPNFSRAIHEGIFFSNFYASGTLSDRGIAAILSGYPALPKTCVIHYENKAQSLPGITKSLKEYNYYSRFLYGGDIDFAHIKAFLISSQFDIIISHKDFPASAYYSKWGVPDHVLFNRLLEECNATEDPFFNVLFTLSSHEPFDVPMKTVIEGVDRESKFLNSIYYTDSCLGEFIEEAKLQPWWDSTLIILVADHGTRIGTKTHYDKKRFHIPMVWMGGAIKYQDTVITQLGSHTDISKTILNQLSVDSKDYLFSKDLFNDNNNSFAYYSCQNGFALLTDSTYMVYDLTNNDFVEEEGPVSDILYNLGKAYLQYVVSDFANR